MKYKVKTRDVTGKTESFIMEASHETEAFMKVITMRPDVDVYAIEPVVLKVDEDENNVINVDFVNKRRMAVA